MESIFILIPIALIFTAIAIKAFFWAVDNRQYDDLDSAGQSILFDEQPSNKQRSKTGDKKPGEKLSTEQMYVDRASTEQTSIDKNSDAN